MNVLVIDSAGRGAALVHKYSQSPLVTKIIAVPGNELMQLNSRIPVVIFPDLKTTSIKEILEIAKKEHVDLVDVAQDNAVEAGATDILTKAGFNVVGPTKAAGQIEWDKAWARDFMKKYKLPIPFYKVFNSKTKAIEFVKKNPNKRFFIKAAGLAEGKGVIPATNYKEALLAIEQMTKFGKSGETFVIEEWLEGEEFSFFALSDGKNYQIAGSAQDHKRLYDGDQGPNTGGIGCSTPPLVITKTIYKQAELIIKKTIAALSKEGRTYKGVLYLGAMVVKGKVYVIEFNARWGSPEAEVLIPGIKNDLFKIGQEIVRGQLKTKLTFDKNSRVAITGSLRPGVDNKKRGIFGIEKIIKLPNITIYGTRVTKKGNRYYVSSGRLFHIVATGKNVVDARRIAYNALSMIYVEDNNLHYRTDIGWRDVDRTYRKP